MGNDRRSWRWLLQLTQILIISSTTSAVSLQDFQRITIFQVPSLSCLGAYGNRISGCTRGDFDSQIQCSEGCAKGIQEEEANVIQACQNIEGLNPKSLLGLTLQGVLLDALCPGLQDVPVTSTVQQTTIQTLSQTTQTSTSSTTEEVTETPSTIPTETATVSSSSTESRTTATTDAETSSFITPTQTEAPSPTVTLSDDTSAPPPTKSPSNKPVGLGSSGGGSPFDPVFPSGSERKSIISVAGALAGILIMMIFQFA
ncbi:hypothetical protein GGS20DRAFT_255689 [Poronia punctata]|nr:hypothetical protein GGS20DRAFT_255689 [Poronia punctata]